MNEPARDFDTDPCPAPPVVLYASLMDELVAERAKAGGTLSEDAEAGFAERLDDLWWQLSNEEQDTWNAQHGGT